VGGSWASAHQIHQAPACHAVALKDLRVAIGIDWIFQLSGDLVDHFRGVSNALEHPSKFSLGDPKAWRVGCGHLPTDLTGERPTPPLTGTELCPAP